MNPELAAIAAKLDAVLALLTQPKPPPPLPPQILSVPEFAKEIGRGTDWVYDQIRRRRITPCRVGKPFQIPRSELNKLRQ